MFRPHIYTPINPGKPTTKSIKVILSLLVYIPVGVIVNLLLYIDIFFETLGWELSLFFLLIIPLEYVMLMFFYYIYVTS